MGLELGLIEINCTALSPGSSYQVPRVERERKRGKLARVTKNLEQITLQRNARRTALKIYSELDDSSLLGSLLPSLALFLPVRSLLFFGKRRPIERKRAREETYERAQKSRKACALFQPACCSATQPTDGSCASSHEIRKYPRLPPLSRLSRFTGHGELVFRPV